MDSLGGYLVQVKGAGSMNNGIPTFPCIHCTVSIGADGRRKTTLCDKCNEERIKAIKSNPQDLIDRKEVILIIGELREEVDRTRAHTEVSIDITEGQEILLDELKSKVEAIKGT